jgi:glycosyltransferase involved in cell wall biosynthesis
MRNRGRGTFEPRGLLEIELSREIPAVSSFTADGSRYDRAIALVRLHGEPLGSMQLELGEHGISAPALAAAIWRELRAPIREHLRRDGLEGIECLTEAGLIDDDVVPGCEQERRALLADTPFVSVVVPTRERPALLERCLRSIEACRYESIEVIVVDSSPPTRVTEELLARLALRDVRYVREGRPGRSWARNRGLAEARGEIVAFADDDVVVDHQWLERIAAAFRADERVACVTAMILPLELETPAQLWIEQYGGFDKGFARRTFDLDQHDDAGPLFPYAAGTYGSGASMAFRADVLREIGGFDPALGSGSPGCGGEELRAFFQVIDRGHRLIYEPAAIVRHAHHPRYDRVRAQVYGYGEGLSAYLTACVVEDPRRLLVFAGKATDGLRYLLSPRSVKNRRKPSDYPKRLTATELHGFVRGPLAYLRGYALARRINKEYGPLDLRQETDRLVASGA